jgi:hypothetical protein
VAYPDKAIVDLRAAHYAALQEEPGTSRRSMRVPESVPKLGQINDFRPVL